MYSLEINFLKDRELPGVQPQSRSAPAAPTPMKEKLIMSVGVGIGLLLPAAVGAFWLWQNNETANLQKQLDDKNAKLTQAAGEQATLDKIKKETKDFQQQTQDLATVFNQIKPWSAMLQDVREKVPPGVQISAITQTNPPPAASAPPANSAAVAVAPPPLPTTDRVEIAGISNSFNRVNDLVLTLQKSPFFKDKDTKLVSASLIDNPIQLFQQQGTGQNNSSQPLPKLPQVVSFKIETYLNEKPASEMLSTLESKGALGLVTRIETLKNQGVIK